MSNNPLIEIRNLTVDYWQQDAWATVVEDLCLRVEPGETFGLVGESGSGKTTTANALLGYRPRGARYRQGSIWFEGRDLLNQPEADLRRLRGAKISFVPQNPTTALSPGMPVGQQIVEILRVHGFCATQKEARERTFDLFRLVSLPNPQQIFRRYPHQLSGGQQQRVTIAMALACDPQLIVLDEPTTGLDVTTQAQILDLLIELRARYGLAMFYITHNLGVVAQICNRIGVMYAGRLVEVAPTRELFQRPRHPYTQGLIAAVPRLNTPTREQTPLLQGLLRRHELPPGCQFAPRCEFAQPRCFEQPQLLTSIDPTPQTNQLSSSTFEPKAPYGQPSNLPTSSHQVACWRWPDIPALAERTQAQPIAPENFLPPHLSVSPPPLLALENLQASYTSERTIGFFKYRPKVIVDEVSFNLWPGETFALVGESGSGKTTVARALSGLVPQVAGRLQFDGHYDLAVPWARRSKELLRTIQLVFQNPDASLNPRQRIGQIISRPLQMFFGLTDKEANVRVENLLADVRLDASYARRFPDELSGGERQRIAIARALAADPKLLLCDEILSALDVSVQANILELLIALNVERELALLFISHDLAVVRSLAHRVGVMYWGMLCEVGTVEEVFTPPFHPYTYLLMSAVPEADPDQPLPPARKDIGLLTQEKKPACPFAQRCPWKVGPVCEEVAPPWQPVSASHQLRCHIPLVELRDLENRRIQPAPASISMPPAEEITL